jgi:hypothetical protein
MRTCPAAGLCALRRCRMCQHDAHPTAGLKRWGDWRCKGEAVGTIVGGSPALGAIVVGAAGTAVGALWEDIHTALK